MRKLALAATGLVFLAGAAWAQDAPKSPASGEQRAAAMVKVLDRMVGGLTPEQTTRAREIYTKQLTDAGSVRQDTSLTPEQRREKLSAISQASQQAVNELLTPEQKEKRQKFLETIRKEAERSQNN